VLNVIRHSYMYLSVDFQVGLVQGDYLFFNDVTGRMTKFTPEVVVEEF